MNIGIHLFYRGLLLGLCELRSTFLCEGIEYTSAFRAVLENALPESQFAKLANELLENFDPVFGVFPEAEGMLLEGQRDFILTFESPQFRNARFLLQKHEATEELNALPMKEIFRKLAIIFNDKLVPIVFLGFE